MYIINTHTASVKLFNAAGIYTTFQLFAVFLALKDKDVGTVEMADKFYDYLVKVGLKSGHRNTVVQCVAEKLNVSFPGIYDARAYED